MTRSMRLLPIAVLCIGQAAHADVVYKCVDAGGKVTYSQNPCYGEDWHRFGDPGATEPKQRPVTPKPASETERANAKPATTAEPAAAKPAPKKPVPTS